MGFLFCFVLNNSLLLLLLLLFLKESGVSFTINIRSSSFRLLPPRVAPGMAGVPAHGVPNTEGTKGCRMWDT